MSNLRLGKKTLTLFALLHNYGYLTTSQLASCTQRSTKTLCNSLRRLAKEGYVERSQKTMTDEIIWCPTPQTITELVKAGYLADRTDSLWNPKSSPRSPTHKQHEVNVNEVRLQFELQASNYEGVKVDRFATGRLIFDRTYDRDGRRYHIGPDALLQLRIDVKPAYYFVEIDRSTEPQKRQEQPEYAERGRTETVKKLYGYQVYYESNGFARKYAGGETSQQWPFRVLMIIEPRTETSSRGRLYNMMIEVIRDLDRRKRNPRYTTYRGYAMFSDVVADPYECHFLRECDVEPIARFLDNRVAGRTLAEALAGGQYQDELAAIPASLRNKTYKSYKQRQRKHDPIRDALLDALIATGRLKRYSVLEHWP